jgi:hypothetical protein
MDTNQHEWERRAGFSPLHWPCGFEVRAVKRRERRAPARFGNSCSLVSIRGKNFSINDQPTTIN